MVTWCCACVVAWLLLSVPLALFFGRACALYQRCRYRDDLSARLDEYRRGERVGLTMDEARQEVDDAE